MVRIPKLKKKIGSFLTKEDGKISKENLIKAGILLSAAVIATLKTADAGHSNTPHSNSITADYSAGTATGTHSHSPAHSNHSSHSSHGSHASHGSHGSHGQW